MNSEETAINPSYDKSLPIEKRLYDFLGKYHIVLNGVVAHYPFMLTYEGKPNERCDDEDKKELVDFVVNHLFHSHTASLVEEMEKEKIQPPEGDAKRFAYHPEYYKGFNQGIDTEIEVVKRMGGKDVSK